MSNQIQIDHSWGDLEEGETYVMNLRDANVLNDDSEGEVVVENANLQSVFRQKILQKRKQALLEHTTKKFLPSQIENDDWASNEKILSKYDDIEKVAESNRQRVKVQIDGQNQNQYHETARTKNLVSLETQKNFGSDYFEAPATFKKRVVEKRPKQSEVEDILDFLEGSTE